MSSRVKVRKAYETWLEHRVNQTASIDLHHTGSTHMISYVQTYKPYRHITTKRKKKKQQNKKKNNCTEKHCVVNCYAILDESYVPMIANYQI